MKRNTTLVKMFGVALIAALLVPASGYAQGPKHKKTSRNNSVVDTLVCPVKAFGHLVAPGWIKKHGAQDIGEDCPLPPGIAKLLGRGGADDDDDDGDVTPPVIVDIEVAVTDVSADISWNTDEDADSAVFYGTTSPVDVDDAGTAVESDDALVAEHDIALDGLEQDTMYHAIVRSRDEAGNETFSDEFSFTTDVAPDIDPPVLSGITVTPGAFSADIHWMTSEPANSRIYFGTTTPLDTEDAGTTVVFNGTLVTIHDLSLIDLEADTTYYFILESEDDEANVGTSGEFSFTTLPAPDITPPVITDIAVVVSGTSSAEVSWSTDEAADGKVFWATTTPVDPDDIGTGMVSTTTLSSDHFFLLTGLEADTTYHVFVESSDGSGNIAASSEFSFTTLAE